MTKTLTEQWRDGELPKGLYYTHSSNGRKGFSIHTCSKSHMFSPYDKMAHQTEEVLAPVPNYNEYKELVTKTEQLEKKLEIAKNALEHMAKFPTYYHDYTGDAAKKALKEMEDIK